MKEGRTQSLQINSNSLPAARFAEPPSALSAPPCHDCNIKVPLFPVVNDPAIKDAAPPAKV